MVNYSIKKNSKHFDIYESKTEQVIITLPKKDQAQKIAMHLNMDGGFAGWTPSFFLKTANYK